MRAPSQLLFVVLLLHMNVGATQKEVETPQGKFRWKELPDTQVATFVRDLTPEETAALDHV